MKRRVWLLGALLVVCMGMSAWAADPIQIRAGVVFQVPLTDGTTAPARCEVVDGKARMTVIASGQFVDFQITAWGGPGPVPPIPIPPIPPPVPPPIPPPQPPVVVLPVLTLITGTGTWCVACTQTEGDTVPGLKANTGITFKRILYTDAEAAKVYPESALVPRWVLTRPDGKVEKKIGYLTPEQIDQWIGIATKK